MIKRSECDSCWFGTLGGVDAAGFWRALNVSGRVVEIATLGQHSSVAVGHVHLMTVAAD